MPFTDEQNIFCEMKKMEENSYKYAIAKSREKYYRNTVPTKMDIYRWIKKFETKGTIHNMRMKSPASKVGPKSTVRSPE